MQNTETDLKRKSAKSISEAIERIEKLGETTGKDFQGVFEKDFNEIKTHLESLKPFLANLQGTVETEVVRRKEQAETQMKENPWMILGIVGIFAFVIGLLVSGSKKHTELR